MINVPKFVPLEPAVANLCFDHLIGVESDVPFLPINNSESDQPGLVWSVAYQSTEFQFQNLQFNGTA